MLPEKAELISCLIDKRWQFDELCTEHQYIGTLKHTRERPTWCPFLEAFSLPLSKEDLEAALAGAAFSAAAEGGRDSCKSVVTCSARDNFVFLCPFPRIRNYGGQ